MEGAVICGGGAQEDIQAVPEIVINGRAGNVDYRVFRCVGKRFLIMIKSNNFIIGIVSADCPCDRAANESESDKADFL